MKMAPGIRVPSFQANTRIRTGDPVLTKDVLYQLSHISIESRGCQRVNYTTAAADCQEVSENSSENLAVFSPSGFLRAPPKGGEFRDLHIVGTRGRFQRKRAARKRRSMMTPVPVSIAATFPAGFHKSTPATAPTTHALA